MATIEIIDTSRNKIFYEF